ncbi:MAG: hypothetical protein GEU74_16100 [Nitriliruptorales bacterium]|nr:hypothetical protein [Nitriliruptorales bacterium]
MRMTPPIVGILVAAVLTVAFWFLLYKPASDEEQAVRDEIAGLEGQQATLRNELAQLQGIQDREVEIRAALARLEELVPAGVAQPAAIRQLQRGADASGAEIGSVTFGLPGLPTSAEGTAPPDTGTEGTTLADIPVTMVVEGGYFQVVDFLRRLEVEVPRAVLVDSVSIAEGETGFPRLAATWTGHMFAVIPTEALADAAGAPLAPPTPAPTPTEGGG